MATEPPLNTGLLESHWFLIGVVQFELLLGFWLASGLWIRAAWCVGLATFSLFAVVAAEKGLMGERSCGCFGRVPTSPWLAFSIDVAVAALALWGSRGQGKCLWVTRHVSAVVGATSACFRPRGALVAPKRLSWLVLMWFPTALCFGAVAVLGGATGELPAIGQRLGGTIVVEPDRMIGRPFALANYIDLGDRLVRGRWLIILYRTACPDCQSVLARSRDIEAQTQGLGGVAYVSVPNYAGASEAYERAEVGQSTGLHGAMMKEHDWLLTVPLFIVVEHDRVLAVSSSLDDALRSLASRSFRVHQL